MGARTGIAWTDATWNPWQGCHKVSPGCTHCYMFREKRQYGQEPNVVVRSKRHTFNLPLRLTAPARIFTCSWSDFFIEEADSWRDEAWAIIRRTPHLTYQILTKRPERIAGRLPWGDGAPWPNVWGLVSAEDQEQADRRVPLILAANFAVRGVSYEPALAPMDFVNVGAMDQCSYVCDHGEQWPEGHRPERGIEWLIIGGESGPGARPFDLAWARSAIAQCRAAGVACFVKQLGAQPFFQRDHGTRESLPLHDRAGVAPEEWPADLRVREFPR